VLVGHVTKDGAIAGPRVLEHMVDTVLSFEGERSHQYRILRATKNRFGGTDEIGVFAMGDAGLAEVANPSALFLTDRGEAVPGAVVFPALEGTRPVLVEIQALTVRLASGATPRRAVVGWDSGRLAMILAVLEARCGLSFSSAEVYLNVAGGYRVTDPAADLAVAAALVSALSERPVPAETVAFGEVALSGELRPVAHAALRLKESAKLGFERALVPAAVAARRASRGSRASGPLPPDLLHLSRQALVAAAALRDAGDRPCRQPSGPGAARHAEHERSGPSGDRREGLAGGMSSPVYVALDTTDLDSAKAIAAKVRNHVGGIKLGLEFFSANGPDGVREMAALGLPVFLDLKLHDIPNTVAKAVQALRPLQPAILTVHAAGGRAMMEDAKAAAPLGTKVVGVSVLTSLDGEDLASIGVGADPHAQVVRLTALAREAGLDGVVCAGAEVGAARKAWPGGFFVVPGVRPTNASAGDQKRVVTPRQALDSGASILVVGRPITQATDPDQAARAIAATL
jgi:orotidine 5'-phosphate decarboxylase subfamily 1